MARRRNNAERLRNAVYAMPTRTKRAMLRGIRSNRVIVGAYVDKGGGVCPMLAAHRNGGRTDFGTFARAWDSFTGANLRRPRRASRREVPVLEGYLQMAPLREGIQGAAPLPARPLAGGVAEGRAPRRRLAAAEAQEASEVTVEDVLATAYAEHVHNEDSHREDSRLESADDWAAELERADAELQRTRS